MSDRLIPLARLVTPFDIFTRWRLSRDEQDAVKIDQELQRTGLPPDPFEHLLVTGEAVAAAHAAQVEWKKDAGARYRKLANLALAVGQIAVELKELIPPPWAGERQVIGTFVAELEDFLFCSLEVTTFAQHIEKIHAAQIAFAKLREYATASRGRVSDAFVGRLAWLASNPDPNRRPAALLQRGAMRPYRGFNINEDSERAGLERAQGTPARRTWRRHLDIPKKIASDASGHRPRAFAAALEAWLKAM
jgi:hypothetical protein